MYKLYTIYTPWSSLHFSELYTNYKKRTHARILRKIPCTIIYHSNARGQYFADDGCTMYYILLGKLIDHKLKKRKKSFNKWRLINFSREVSSNFSLLFINSKYFQKRIYISIILTVKCQTCNLRGTRWNIFSWEIRILNASTKNRAATRMQ